MCTTFIAKLILGIVNTLVFLVGLVMFVIGILIHTQPELSQKALSSVLEKLEEVADKAGETVDTSAFSVADVAYSFTIPIIVMGIFLAGVSLLGIIGVKYGVKIVLIVYFIITLVLFLAQVAVLLCAVIDRSVFDDQVKPRLKENIQEYYAGIGGKDATSQIWNGVMAYMECCGVDDYNDFKTDVKNWPPSGQEDLVTPIACCKSDEIVKPSFICAKAPTDDTNNWKTGCYTKMWNYLLSNSGIVIAIATAVLMAQLVILLLTCMIMNSQGKVDPI